MKTSDLISEAIVLFQGVNFSYQEGKPVFQSLDLAIPSGVTSLVGQNGTGKSTLMLLASGRILPQTGSVSLLGQDTKGLDEAQRAQLASMVYQNMEFEEEAPLGDLLATVWEAGFWKDMDKEVIFQEVSKALELENHLHKKTRILSKGEMQRAVMAFSLLYGSRTVMMDEPVFALEDYQKERCLGFIGEFSTAHGQSFVFSAHELDLTKKYSEKMILFFKQGAPRVGATEKLFDRDLIEEAYQVPMELLKKKENLFRESLQVDQLSSELQKSALTSSQEDPGSSLDEKAGD